MKKLLTGLLSAAMVFALAGCGSSKDHLATIQDKGEITIGLEGDWQPFSYHDKNDKLVGVDVEVAISSLPFFTIEQLVSSQLLSIPNI